MKMRHRVPMVFSLSMLDVFCCALGCVTLLWLINQREAMLRAKANSNISSTLNVTRAELRKLRDQFAAAVTERDKLATSARQLRDDLAVANEEADRLSKSLASATRRADDTADRLTKAQTNIQTLTRERETALSRAADLTERLHDEEARFAAADRRSADLSSRLRDAEAQASQLRTTAELVPGLKQSADRVAGLESELAVARRAAATWEGERRDLTNRIAKAQAAIDNRFEGIGLTGRRVIFLVDTSGSMEMLDGNTAAPNKWAGVRDTLLKILRSLPDLEKFQVILFSEQLQYPLGNEGRWLDPDAQVAGRLQTALSTTKPKGNTNMYLGLDAAFRFRPQGLDTIYLLSDGLPNTGEGLTAEQSNSMTEMQRSEVLSKYIRNSLKTNWNVAQQGRRVKINSVGFFYESPDVGAFLWALSRENEGSFVGMNKP